MDNIRCQKNMFNDFIIHDHEVDEDGGKQDCEIKLKREGKDQALQLQGRPSPPPSVVASPPSASSSPSREFSFAISLHHSPSAAHDKTKTTNSPSSFSVDLSPADDIFFHGHLLPLHLLSRLPVSPRSSTNLMGSFTLPIKDSLLEDDQKQNKTSGNIMITDRDDEEDLHQYRSNYDYNGNEAKARAKSKSSFSLFGLPKWRKGYEVQETERERQKRKLKFDVSHVLKRYIRMVRPLLTFRSRRASMNIQRKSHSFSGNLSFRDKKKKKKKDVNRGRRGEYSYSSAPASMWTSPTNSGHLVANGSSTHTSTSDSTMEELQAAIQAAIAHCKNSIATEEKKKQHHYD